MNFNNYTDYSAQDLEEMAKGFPPPGHPHYIPIEERLKAIGHPQFSPAVRKEPTMSSAAATKYQELKAKIADARKQMEATAKTAFTDMAKEFFENNPTVLAFGWTQYTPYFNDGDACNFSAHTDYPTVTMLVDGQALTYNSNSGELEDADGEEIKSADSWIRQFKSLGNIDSFTSNGRVIAYDKKANRVTIDGVLVKTYDEISSTFDNAQEQVSDFLGNFDNDDLETMFGDHMQIMVARDGTIETEEYSHD